MEKALLRREFLQKRKDLTQNEVDDKSLEIAKNVIKLLLEVPLQTIHIFLPQKNKTEVNTWLIISEIRSNFPKIQIVAPYVIPGTKELDHYLFDEKTVLIENKWGIPEPDPQTSVKILPETLDVVFIPLLAFDKNGYRVGYGGGFYDRFLIKCRPDALKVGLSFFEPVEEIDGLDAFDVRMHACVFPNGVICWD